MRALFITATGTGVGKTLVTCALAWQLRRQGHRVKVLKPLVSGYDARNAGGSDPHLILEALDQPISPAGIDRVSPFRFAAPLAPDAAAAREDRKIDFEALVDYCQKAMSWDADYLLIEGIGGAFVPLAGDRTIADWIEALQVPAILVASNYLGCLSHTIATVEAMRARNLPVAGVIINDATGDALSLADSATALTPFLGDIPITGIPHLSPSPKLWRQVPRIGIGLS
ncbi:MAG: dethiobiotin synthase [Sphingomonadales bacterium]